MSLWRRVTTFWGSLPRVLLVGLACLWGVAQGITYYGIAFNTVQARQMGDFGVFYQSSQRVLNDLGDPYDPPPTSPHTPNLNPPHVIVWLVPLALLGPRPALLWWAVASVCSALAAVGIVFKELQLKPTPRALGVVLFCGLIAAPTGALLFTAQNSWLLWGPLTFAWSLARRGRWTAAAVTLGIVMSIKPFLGLFVPMLIVTRRRFPALVAACVAVACLVSGMAVLGTSAYVSWWRAVQSITWARHVFNASSFGFLERLFTDRTDPLLWHLAPATQAEWVVVPLWIGVAGALCVAALWAVRPRGSTATDDRTPASVDRLFAITTCTALLVTPLAWIYYEFFLVGPFLALCANQWWRHALRWRSGLLWFAGVSLVLTPGLLVAGQPQSWATLSVGSAYFWGLLALWICAVTRVETDGVVGPDPLTQIERRPAAV